MVFGWCDDLLVFDFLSWKSWGPLSGAPNKNRWNMERYHAVNGDFLKWWYPTTMGFPTKHDHFGMFCGYHHLGNTQIGELFFKRIVSAISLRLVKHSLIHLPFFLRNLTPNWIFDTTKPCLRLPQRPFFYKAAKQGEDVSSLLLWGPGPFRAVDRWKEWFLEVGMPRGINNWKLPEI